MTNSRTKFRSAAYGAVIAGLLSMCLLLLLSRSVDMVYKFRGLFLLVGAATYCYRRARTTPKSGVRWTGIGAHLKSQGGFTLYLRSFKDDEFYFDAV